MCCVGEVTQVCSTRQVDQQWAVDGATAVVCGVLWMVRGEECVVDGEGCVVCCVW